MSTGPTHFKYFCSRCQVEHLQPFSGPAPRPEDIPTSCGNDFPAFPSAIVAIPPEKYMEAMEATCKTPKVFFDGETILLPEHEHQVIAMLIERFGGIASVGHAKEYEYATLASQAGTSWPWSTRALQRQPKTEPRNGGRLPSLRKPMATPKWPPGVSPKQLSGKQWRFFALPSSEQSATWIQGREHERRTK